MHSREKDNRPNVALTPGGESDLVTQMMTLADQIASCSKDPHAQVGCVIVGHNNDVLASGYNGFPRGISDDDPARLMLPDKYRWSEHAERNAIYKAARSGIAIAGCSVFVTWYPCAACARAIIQCDIACVVAREPNWSDDRWAADFAVTRQLFEEASVPVEWFVPSQSTKK